MFLGLGGGCWLYTHEGLDLGAQSSQYSCGEVGEQSEVLRAHGPDRKM